MINIHHENKTRQIIIVDIRITSGKLKKKIRVAFEIRSATSTILNVTIVPQM